MLRVTDSINLLHIIQNKCRLRQSFLKIERRNQVFIILDKKIQYKYSRRKSPNYNKTITRNRIAVLYKAVKQAYHDYIVKNNFEIDVPEKIASIRATNKNIFNNMAIGDMFYKIDISHAYWQISWRIGMLSDKLYENYNNDKQIKQFRNMSLTSVLAPKTVDVFINGRLRSTFIEDTTIYKHVYKKIRIICYNLIAEVKKSLGDKWIDYNVDAISFLPEALETVQNKLKELDYKYKIMECEKLSETEYREDDVVKYFYRKSKSYSKTV
jgi:hypothetical protein